MTKCKRCGTVLVFFCEELFRFARGLSKLLCLLKITIKLLKSFYHLNSCLHLCIRLQLDYSSTFTCIMVDFSFSGLDNGA